MDTYAPHGGPPDFPSKCHVLCSRLLHAKQIASEWVDRPPRSAICRPEAAGENCPISGHSSAAAPPMRCERFHHAHPRPGAQTGPKGRTKAQILTHMWGKTGESGQLSLNDPNMTADWDLNPRGAVLADKATKTPISTLFGANGAPFRPQTPLRRSPQAWAVPRSPRILWPEERSGAAPPGDPRKPRKAPQSPPHGSVWGLPGAICGPVAPAPPIGCPWGLHRRVLTQLAAAAAAVAVALLQQSGGPRGRRRRGATLG